MRNDKERISELERLLRKCWPCINGATDELHDELREVLAGQQQQGEPCDTCDGSGDVHRADGEWMGECPHCKAEQPAAVDEPTAPAAVAEVIWPPSDIRHGAFKMLCSSSELMAGVKLYTAAALAPAAAVVMPERMTTIPEGKTISYAAGYEAALDAVASLNRNTVPLELLDGILQYCDQLLGELNGMYQYSGSTGDDKQHRDSDYLELRAILAGDKP